MDTIRDDQSIYEIGYLISCSVPLDAVSGEIENLKKILSSSGAEIIAEGEPFHQDLAYEMRVKKVSGSYEKFKEAYFGWIKFEVGSDMIDGIKESAEKLPSILRLLVTATVRENTFLGKRASAILMKPVTTPPGVPATEDKKEVVPVTIEEMDKSIDEMVKEA